MKGIDLRKPLFAAKGRGSVQSTVLGTAPSAGTIFRPSRYTLIATPHRHARNVAFSLWAETAHLVQDFNAMAQSLEDLAADMKLWNATIAHELRTPLTILKGRLRGMIDGVFEPDETALQALVMQVDSLARLVEDLRTVTLADSGHLDLCLEPVRLKQEIEQLGNLVEQELRKERFELRLSLADIVVQAYAMRIRQVLLALVTNARRHAVRGAIDVMLGVEDRVTRLRVIDEGPGLG